MSYIIQKETLSTGVIVFLLGFVGTGATPSWSSRRHTAQRFARKDDAKQIAKNLHAGDDERITIVMDQE